MSIPLDSITSLMFDRISITDVLLNHCTPATIYRFGRTCKLLRRTTQFYCKRAFDINARLRHFLADPVGFRTLMARTGTIISGSNALQFMGRTVYRHSDLDVYTEQRHSKEVGRWLVEQEGYTFRPHTDQPHDFESATETRTDVDDPEYKINSVYSVLDFVSAPLADGSQRTVQVIIAMKSVMECVFEFHSTAVMNVITHCAAYSLYPKGTFEEMRSLVTDGRYTLHRRALEKYAARGYRNVAQLMPNEADSPTSPFRPERWVGDDVTWILPLDMTGVKIMPLSRTTPALSFDPITLCSWNHVELVSKENGLLEDVTVQYAIHHSELNSELLYYRYTVPQDFVSLMMPFFRKHGAMEYVIRDSNNKEFWFWSDEELPAWRKILFEKRQDPGWIRHV